VLSGRGLCDELITRPEESYRLWCVVVCDLEKITLQNEDEGQDPLSGYRAKKEKKVHFTITIFTVILTVTWDPTGKKTHTTDVLELTRLCFIVAVLSYKRSDAGLIN